MPSSPTSPPSPGPAFDASTPVRALVIAPGGVDAEVRQVLANDGDEMRRLVGGWLDALTLHDVGSDDVEVAMWFDEDGATKSLDPNPAATALAYGAGVFVGGTLVGPVVVTGLVWGGSNGGQVAADVPDETLAFARAQGLTVSDG